jgi:hypothetical protein
MLLRVPKILEKLSLNFLKRNRVLSDLISYLKGRLHRIYVVQTISAVRGLYVGNMKFNTRTDEFNVHGSVHRNNISVSNSN